MKNLKLLLAAFVALLAAACATTPDEPPVRTPAAAFFAKARILFQGDSITDGNRGRNSDLNHILGHGYQALIASRVGADFPERELTFMNRGVSGNKVSDLQARWQTDTIDLRPHILSILIGINDLNAGVSTTTFEKQYDELLDATRRALPNIRLILGEPFALPVGGVQPKWERFRAELEQRQAVVARLGQKYRATVVHFQKAFDDAVTRAPAEYWIWDGIHPTYAGHQIMADEWARSVFGPQGAGK